MLDEKRKSIIEARMDLIKKECISENCPEMVVVSALLVDLTTDMVLAKTKEEKERVQTPFDYVADHCSKKLSPLIYRGLMPFSLCLGIQKEECISICVTHVKKIINEMAAKSRIKEMEGDH